MSATWAEISAGAGRNDLPAILAHAFVDDWLERDELAKAVVDAWSMAEWPGRTLEPRYWLMMFRSAAGDVGWLDDQGLTHPPEQLAPSISLWRGATEAYREGLSWTADRDRAYWFATRLGPLAGAGACQLYEITIDPEIVLAKLDARREDEYVVDVELLLEDDIVEVALSPKGKARKAKATKPARAGQPE